MASGYSCYSPLSIMGNGAPVRSPLVIAPRNRATMPRPRLDFSGFHPRHLHHPRGLMSRPRQQHFPRIHSGGDKRAWSFICEKPIIFIGDSNLARIPKFPYLNVQVESFSGANFVNIDWMMKRRFARNHIENHVQTVVLCQGINLRDSTDSTMIKVQLALLHRRCREVFPNAIIYVAQTNFSPGLSLRQRDTLNTLNDYIAVNYRYLKPLEASKFQTTPDNIHWTPETARLIFQHYLSQINY